MKITVETLRGWKGCGPFGALTAYDYPGARLLDEAGVPVLLVKHASDTRYDAGRTVTTHVRTSRDLSLTTK